MQENLKRRLQEGEFDKPLSTLYGEAHLGEARDRCSRVMAEFSKTFGTEPEALFSAPGRTEIGGNHTDHQHGRVLAGSVDLDILAAVAVNHSGLVRVRSEGYPMLTVALDQLSPHPEEKNTSAALIRGVAARMQALGCPLQDAGLDVCMVSNVPGGSGLSSSAAFEVLMGAILNECFWGGKATPVELAQIGQFAENVYFGKPSGLLDQAACAVGGVTAMDFGDPAAPVVERIGLDLEKEGYALCILDSHASHADLTGEYGAVTEEMGAVSRYFGKAVLREVPEEAFYAALPKLRQAAGDRAVLRCMHFYAEDRRAAEEAEALKKGNFGAFLALVRQSGHSSAEYLQNVVPLGHTTDQSLMFTIALAEKLLGGRGAVRVHGGGFAGTAQAFVPLELLEEFRSGMEAVLGKHSCHVVTIRPVGAFQII